MGPRTVIFFQCYVSSLYVVPNETENHNLPTYLYIHFLTDQPTNKQTRTLDARPKYTDNLVLPKGIPELEFWWHFCDLTKIINNRKMIWDLFPM